MVPQIPAPLGSRALTPVTTGSLHFSAQPHSISITPVVRTMLLSLFFLHLGRKSMNLWVLEHLHPAVRRLLALCPVALLGVPPDPITTA